MKRTIPTETIRLMGDLSRRGVSDYEIGKRFKLGRSAVDMALARVAPDGHVMESQYGDKRNDPRHVRSGCSVGLVNEIPVAFLHSKSRRYA